MKFKSVFISCFRVKNVAMMEDVTFFFRKDLNVFICNNGSGKTTLLDCIYCLGNLVHDYLDSGYPRYNFVAICRLLRMRTDKDKLFELSADLESHCGAAASVSFILDQSGARVDITGDMSVVKAYALKDMGNDDSLDGFRIPIFNTKEITEVGEGSTLKSEK